jgi:hypothetical protein
MHSVEMFLTPSTRGKPAMAADFVTSMLAASGARRSRRFNPEAM